MRSFAARRLGSAALAERLLPVAPDELAAAAGTPVPAVPTFAALAAAYPALLDATQRKRHGAWFTSDALAAPTVRRTLEPLLSTKDPASLRICDPAVGGGTFLLAALQCLVGAGLRARDAALCLHGRDLDSTAAALAVLVLWEACGDDHPDLDRLAAQVCCGDGLLDQPRGSFDAVLTNPPWETLQSAPGARGRTARLRPHFRCQGAGKLYTYRLFVERAIQLLAAGGRFGLIVPASLWFDRDAAPLRNLLLDENDWEWLFGFENRRKLFSIDGRYRFAAIVGGKGGCTRAVKTTFGRVDVADWAAHAPRHARYGRDEIQRLSPGSGTFVEVEEPRDLDVLRRLAEHGRPLLGEQGLFEWRQGDFNMTADRDRFVLRDDAEQGGYRRTETGIWRRGDPREDLLPLYQGAMVYDLHPNTGAHAGGTGHGTRWEPPHRLDDLRPAYLVPAQPWRSKALQRTRARIALRALSNATNERTAVACLLPDVPCGNSLGVLVPRRLGAAPLRTMAAGAAVLGSLPFDWALRLRLGGTNLNGFVLADCVVPHLPGPVERELAALALRLCAILPWHDALWATAAAEGWLAADDRAAVTPAERADLLTRIDALVGHAFGLRTDDVAWIVRGCAEPSERIARTPPPSCHAKGFWRIERTLPAAARRPNRWLAAAR